MSLNFNKIFSFLFLAGLFVSPLVFWSGARVPFEIPKVWFIIRWIEILAGAGILAFSFKVKNNIDFKLTFLVFTFFLWALFSSFSGVNFVKSFSGNFYRMDGLFTLIHLVIFYLLVTIFVKGKLLIRSLRVIYLSAVLLSIFSVISAVFYYLFNYKFTFFDDWNGAMGVNFGNPNFLAGYLVVTLPFNYYFRRTRKSSLATALFVIQILAILFTRAWAGAFLLLVFFLVLQILENKNRKLILILIPILIYLGASVYLINNNILYYKGDLIAESRGRIFTKGVIGFTKRPLTGWGWANFDKAFESNDWPLKIYNDVYVDKAHSHFLEILATTGVVGLILYLSIIARAFLNIKNSKPARQTGGLETKNYLLIALILFVIHSQTNIISISEELIFWYLLGVSSYPGNNIKI